ncbi:MAG: hypothetical protein V3T01_06850 [Myxococcota bacterium]
MATEGFSNGLLASAETIAATTRAKAATDFVSASFAFMACCHHCLFLILLVGLPAAGSASDLTTAPDTHPAQSSRISRQVAAPPFRASDVVIAIDHSAVALLASGIDVDGDGVVGRNRQWIGEKESIPTSAWSWTTDSDDTVEALQLRVAQALVATLAERENRIGLVSFTRRAWSRGTSLVRLVDRPSIVVPVGSPNAVLATLADFPAVRERRHTDLARLLALAAELLDGASPLEPTRPRAILLLSLGEPSAPDGLHWSSRRAIALAGSLGERGIGVWAIPFGALNLAYLQELTGSSGGAVVPLAQLDAVFAVVPPPEVVSPPLGPE